MAEYRGTEVFRTNSRVAFVDEEPVDARKTAHLGFSATVLAAGLLFVVAYAVMASAGGDFEKGTVLAWVAIVGTILTGLMGAAALVMGYGRLWGFVAVVLSLVANPVTLTAILDAVGSLAATS